MFHYRSSTLLGLLLQCLNLVRADQSCKAYLGSPSWPSPSKWKALNASISGQLLQPPPPGAVCHPDQPTYNQAICPTIQYLWNNSVDWHATNPISSAWNNWNNDSCLPFLPSPCSGEGYPVYVVNATSKKHVKKGVDFARENNVRLVVKASGHDYLGRSIAPNSLSIWTYNMKGISFHDGFRPRGCHFSIDTPAVTFAPGELMTDINLATSLKNLTVISGGQASVAYGGYMTGSGHGALGPTYGMAADNALELEIVTPGGHIVTANECQNQDLFWAMRGGGGSTFGVITSTTIKAFPSPPIYLYATTIGTLPNSEPFWDALTYWFSQYPSLAEQGIAGYHNIFPNTSLNGTEFGGLQGAFLLPGVSPANTSASLAAAIEPIIAHIGETWPGLFANETSSVTFPSFWAFWEPTNSPDNAGADMMVGSRLLDAEALAGNSTALKIALQAAMPGNSGGQANFISGKGVWNAKPRGGSDAVNPAWRKALVHFVLGVTWPPFDTAAKAEEIDLLTNHYVEALRVLTPDLGCYQNEADAEEPNFQQAFWGDNYERLLDIKRCVDPDDVFWCTPCVGNDRWKEVGNLLCRV